MFVELFFMSLKNHFPPKIHQNNKENDKRKRERVRDMVKVGWRFKKLLPLYFVLLFFRRVQMATFLPAIIFLCLLVAVVFILAVTYCILQKFPYCCDSHGCGDKKDVDSDSESSGSEQEEQDLGDEKEEELDDKKVEEETPVQHTLEEVVIHESVEDDEKAAFVKEDIRLAVHENDRDHDDNIRMNRSVTISTPYHVSSNESIGKSLLSKFIKPSTKNNTELPRYGSTMNSPMSERSMSMRSFFSSSSMLSHTSFHNGKSFCTSDLLPVHVQVLVVYDQTKETLSVGVKHLESSSFGNSTTVYWQVAMEMVNCLHPENEDDRFPGISRIGKVKTKYKAGMNVMFNKDFEVENIEKSELEHFAVKYSVFVRAKARTARKRLVGTSQVLLLELTKEHASTIFEWREIVDSTVDDFLI